MTNLYKSLANEQPWWAQVGGLQRGRTEELFTKSENEHELDELGQHQCERN